MKTKKIPLILFIALLVIISFVSGLMMGAHKNFNRAQADGSANLRAAGKFTSPLLLTGYGEPGSAPALAGLESTVNKKIAELKDANAVSDVSIYYRNSGQQMEINGDQKYFPASLSKVPLMMAYYKLSESQPELLTQKGALDFDIDYNAGQEIAPSKFPVSGQEYSIEELIEMMIRNSDNAGFNLLMARPGTGDVLKNMFEDLQLFYPYEQTAVKEVITVREFSRFFRVLRNSTYLSDEHSEKALELLSQVDYKNGIVAGLPDGIVVSHKYGLSTQRDINTGEVLERQLHDCGIVYYPDDPYVLCVMTKSHAMELKDVEQALQQISKSVYDYVKNNKK